MDQILFAHVATVCCIERVLFHATQLDIPSVVMTYYSVCLVLTSDVCDTGKEWVCITCARELKRGMIPLQAKANGLQLSDIPNELSGWN